MDTDDTGAGLGKRVGARAIDWLIVGPAVVIGYVLLGTADSGVLTLVGVMLVLGAAAAAVYNQIIRVGRRGHSIGKQVVGITVLDQDARKPIGVGRALGRDLVFSLLFAACWIPGIVNIVIAAKDPRRQGWHDKAVRSVVLGTTAPTAGAATAGAATDSPSPETAPRAPSMATEATAPPPYTPAAPPPAAETLAAPPPIPAPEQGSPHASEEAPPTPPNGMVAPPPGVVPPPPAPVATADPDATTDPEEDPAAPDDPPGAAGATPAGWTLTTPTGSSWVVEGLLLVGRDPDPSLVEGADVWPIDDPQLTMSKTHALLGLEDGTAWVEDWHSTNGVALHRGEAALVIEPHARTPLRDGDVIEFGAYKISVEGTS